MGRTLKPCVHINSNRVRVEGSNRVWLSCRNGYGSTLPEAKGLVCGCHSPLAGVWRIGKECGESCPGYTIPGGNISRHLQPLGSPHMPEPVRWAYGVTTVPSRRNTLLPQTLESLTRGGFSRPHLFIDGDGDGASWEREFNLYATARGGLNVKTYGHWVLSIAELYVRFPLATRYAVFQDDFVCVKNLRTYLEKTPYPERGYLNLYTFPVNQALAEPGTTGWFRSNQKGLGAVALVFNKETVLTLLTHQHMVERPMDAKKGYKAVDGGIVTALNKAGWSEYVHSPSLVQHTGAKSAMHNRQHPLAINFPGEDFDATEFLNERAQV